MHTHQDTRHYFAVCIYYIICCFSKRFTLVKLMISLEINESLQLSYEKFREQNEDEGCSLKSLLQWNTIMQEKNFLPILMFSYYDCA